MLIWIAWMLGFGGMFDLVAVDAAIHTDDFLCVSCPLPSACYVLDRAGTLFFSRDGARTLFPRARLREHDFRKIRFRGLVDGFALDSKGRLWRSRNGGRDFTPVPDAGGEHLSRPWRDLELDPDRILWLVNQAGDISRVRPDGGVDHPLHGTRGPLAGPPGALAPARLPGGWLEALPAAPQRQWNDASARGSEWVVVGDGGAIGRLWLDERHAPGFEQLSTNPPALVAVQSLGDRRAVAAFADGSLRWSSDAGRSWLEIPSSGPAPGRLHFTDASRGFALNGVHELIGTADSGRTWKRLGNWPDLALEDLWFLDARRGWAVGGAGALVRTIDGGRSWTLDRLPGFDTDLNRVQFLNRNLGYAVGGDQNIFRTRDGGKTWQRLVFGHGNLYGLAFLDPRQGFVAGDGGLVMATTDGGDSWTPRPAPTSEPIRCLVFSDPLRGLAGGAGGLLFATRDGGLSWHRVELHTLAGINDLACFARTGRCLIGGDRGLLRLGDPFRQVR